MSLTEHNTVEPVSAVTRVTRSPSVRQSVGEVPSEFVFIVCTITCSNGHTVLR